MRRLWAMLLLGLVGFTLIGPALVASDSGTVLPACCRRDGKHHCGMEAKSTAGPAWQKARCASFPVVKGLPAARDFAAASTSSNWAFEPVPAEHTAQPPTTSVDRAAFRAVHPKRGPPALS